MKDDLYYQTRARRTGFRSWLRMKPISETPDSDGQQRVTTGFETQPSNGVSDTTTIATAQADDRKDAEASAE